MDPHGFSETRDGYLFSTSEFGFERMIFPESAYAEHAETDDTALLVHALHHRIAFSRPHVSGRVRKSHFKVINFRVKPQFYFIGHNASPDLLVSVRLLRLPLLPATSHTGAPRSRSTLTIPQSCCCIDRDGEDLMLRCRRPDHTAPQPLERGACGAPLLFGSLSGVGDPESTRT
jgi:hypothetical protein